jgi:putative phosphoribosyl transferase
MILADRDEAGRALALQVAQYRAADTVSSRPLVLALPRGGVPVAAPVADAIGGDLDIVLARKIGAPGQPELGVGAIAEDGPPVFDDTALHYLGITTDDLADTVEQERAELTRRAHRYRRDQPAPHVADRTVVLVDDGLATGVTAHAAVRWLHTRRPRRLVLAPGRPTTRSPPTPTPSSACTHRNGSSRSGTGTPTSTSSPTTTSNRP